MEFQTSALIRKTLIHSISEFGTQYVTDYEHGSFHLNKVDDFGNTLLLIAAQNGNMKISKLLFAKGANTNHQNKQGQTALHYAMNTITLTLVHGLLTPKMEGAGDTLENAFQLKCVHSLFVVACTFSFFA